MCLFVHCEKKKYCLLHSQNILFSLSAGHHGYNWHSKRISHSQVGGVSVEPPHPLKTFSFFTVFIWRKKNFFCWPTFLVDHSSDAVKSTTMAKQVFLCLYRTQLTRGLYLCYSVLYLYMGISYSHSHGLPCAQRCYF